MTTYQVRALRWVTVLLVLAFVRVSLAQVIMDQESNNFDLGNFKSQEQIEQEQQDRTAEGMIAKAKQIFGIGPAISEEHKQAVIEIIKSGDNDSVVRLCDIDNEYDFSINEGRCAQTIRELSKRGHLRAMMNGSTGQYKQRNAHPLAEADQVKTIYPIYTQSNGEGLAFYLAVSSNGTEKVSLLDPLKDFGIMSDNENGSTSHVGVIYVIKLGGQKRN